MHRKENSTAKTASALRTDPAKFVVPDAQRVNNLGGGSCGAYSIGIGLVADMQKEIKQNKQADADGILNKLFSAIQAGPAYREMIIRKIENFDYHNPDPVVQEFFSKSLRSILVYKLEHEEIPRDGILTEARNIFNVLLTKGDLTYIRGSDMYEDSEFRHFTQKQVELYSKFKLDATLDVTVLEEAFLEEFEKSGLLKKFVDTKLNHKTYLTETDLNHLGKEFAKEVVCSEGAAKVQAKLNNDYIQLNHEAGFLRKMAGKEHWTVQIPMSVIKEAIKEAEAKKDKDRPVKAEQKHLQNFVKSIIALAEYAYADRGRLEDAVKRRQEAKALVKVLEDAGSDHFIQKLRSGGTLEAADIKLLDGIASKVAAAANDPASKRSGSKNLSNILSELMFTTTILSTSLTSMRHAKVSASIASQNAMPDSGRESFKDDTPGVRNPRSPR